MTPAQAPEAVKNASELASFLQIKELEAQVALYRGYLHEVNNALAGIGTLAELMQTMGPEGIRRNFALMAQATQRSAALQRRIRTLMSPGVAVPCQLSSFVEENKDLIGLMLPHSQRLTFEIAQNEHIAEASPSLLWRWVSLLVIWLREAQISKAAIEVSSEGLFILHLHAESNSLPQGLWADALQSAAEVIPGVLEIKNNFVALSLK